MDAPAIPGPGRNLKSYASSLVHLTILFVLRPVGKPILHFFQSRYGASLGGPLCNIYDPTLGLYILVLVYIRRVMMTRRVRNTQHKDLTNTITMVMEPPTPLLVWI